MSDDISFSDPEPGSGSTDPPPSSPAATPTYFQPSSRPGQWQPPTPEILQEQLPQYKILDLLGRGGMGAVYKGWQTSFDRYVAIKIMPPDMEDGDAQFAARFKQEAKTMAKFQHPGIVAVIDAGETTAGTLYIVMEFIEGTDVSQMVKSQGRLPPAHALAITAHVCDALQYAHERGVIHRDIKPANIMMNMEGQVKVADFGLAKGADAGQGGLTKTNMAMGTPDYVAPEALISGMLVDHRADLYAIGVMLYNMLTGDIPRGMFRPPSQKVGSDPRFDRIIGKAMEQEREHRYQSAREIRWDLDVILTTPEEKASPPAQEARGPVRQKPVMKGPGPDGQVRTEEDRKPDTFKGARRTGKKSSTGNLIAILGSLAVLVAGAWVMLKPKPPATTPSTDSADGETWVDGLAEWWAVNAKHEDVEHMLKKEAGGSRFVDTPSVWAWAKQEESKSDVALRATVSGAKYFDLDLRTGAHNSRYAAAISHNGGVIEIDPDGGSIERLKRFDLPAGFVISDRHTGEFRVQGDTLTYLLDGHEMASVKDGRRVTGGGYLVASPGTLIEKLEYSDLSPTVITLPTASATKTAPFVNTLGMKFVPVPIIGGPTDKQRVLFSMWETRVQDYETFARQTRRPLLTAGFEQGPTHPVVNVSGVDAQAFCAWLTEKERKDGKLDANEAYRLPSDREWSCAAGIADREDATVVPDRRTQRLKNVFPWGDAWPPSANAGNYNGEENTGQAIHEEQQILAGHRDPFPFTSPVGSFAANPFGLYDLGGNAWEWCENAGSTSESKHTLRGASFGTSDQPSLESSNRRTPKVAEKRAGYGFRVVLAPAKP